MSPGLHSVQADSAVVNIARNNPVILLLLGASVRVVVDVVVVSNSLHLPYVYPMSLHVFPQLRVVVEVVVVVVVEVVDVDEVVVVVWHTNTSSNQTSSWSSSFPPVNTMLPGTMIFESVTLMYNVPSTKAAILSSSTLIWWRCH